MADYVCPQCGPAPEGADRHAERMHAWPQREPMNDDEAAAYYENREPTGPGRKRYGRHLGWMNNLGRATWLWDNDLQVHIPCCTREVLDGRYPAGLRACGNGPLGDSQVEEGDCGEHGPRDAEAEERLRRERGW